MGRRLAVLVLASVCLVTLPACPAFFAALPQIVAVVTDAILVLDQIEEFCASYFAKSPNVKLQTDVANALGKCRNALVAAQRVAKGTEKLDQEQTDAAFADFRAAWTELSALLTGIPGLRVQRAGETTLTAAPGELVVPEPEALRVEVAP